MIPLFALYKIQNSPNKIKNEVKKCEKLKKNDNNEDQKENIINPVDPPRNKSNTITSLDGNQVNQFNKSLFQKESIIITDEDIHLGEQKEDKQPKEAASNRSEPSKSIYKSEEQKESGNSSLYLRSFMRIINLKRRIVKKKQKSMNLVYDINEFQEKDLRNMPSILIDETIPDNKIKEGTLERQYKKRVRNSSKRKLQYFFNERSKEIKMSVKVNNQKDLELIHIRRKSKTMSRLQIPEKLLKSRIKSQSEFDIDTSRSINSQKSFNQQKDNDTDSEEYLGRKEREKLIDQ